MTDYTRLDRLAGRQHGLVALRQARRLHLTRRQIDHRRSTGAMAMVRRGVHRWCGTTPTWRMMAMAAVLAAGEAAVLSHRSAGVLWGLLPSGEGGDRLEITSPRQTRRRGIRAHRHALTAQEATRRDGIPVTTAERTLLDLAESCDANLLGQLVDEALRRGLTTLARIEAQLRARSGRGRRRTRPLREALQERGAGYDPGDNPGERDMDRLWDRLGLPPAARQHKVRVRNRTYVLDRAIVELKIGIEWNGRDRHGLWSRFHYDSDRRNDLIEQGWLILDFTMKTSPERIVRTVEAAVAQRRLLLLSA